MGSTSGLQRVLGLYHDGHIQQALDTALENVHIPSYTAELSHLIAACYHSLGDHQTALPHLRTAIKLDPTNAGYLNTYGVILRKAKFLESAVKAYAISTRLDPLFADAYYNCANSLVELERKDEAIDFFNKCLTLKPNHDNAHHNLANIYRDKNDISLALKHYELSNDSNAVNSDMHCNWGLALQLNEQWSAAISQFEIAISQKADHAPSYVNLGGALSVQERFDEACSAFRRGVELDDSCNDAKFNLGLTLLTIGQLREGWHFYETRLSLPKKVITPFPDIPIWDGSLDIDGPLLVWAEQGYGDNIQFVRYISILQELGVDVVLSTRKPLISLFRQCLRPSSPPIVEHIRSELQGFNHHIPLLSLPKVFKTDLHTIPRTPGYLSISDPIPLNLVVPRHPFALNVAIVWASGADNKDMYADKSISLADLMPIFDQWRDQKLISLHSLQVGVDSEQLSPWRNEWGIYDWSSQVNSFLDTAYIVNQMDLVISVDTAVAHLSGALNKSTWVLLQHNADFRWLRGRSDSPWYNSMTLFRQASLGDWKSAIDAMRSSLQQLLG